MKKWIAILLVLALTLSMAACGAKEEPHPTETKTSTTAPTEEKPAEEETPTTAPTEETPTEAETAPIEIPELSGDDLDSQIEAAVALVLDSLSAEYESIVEGVDSYETYMDKADEIAAFYERLNAASADLCIQMRVFALTYAENILVSGMDTDDMYDDMDIVYDLIYDDMGDEIYDGIYNGILEDLYDDFYDGALDDRPDDVEHSDWSDARSKEYDQWSGTRSETYDHWADFRSDVYDFWSDIRSELWGDELEDAQEELDDFREDVEKMMGKEASESSETVPTETTNDDSDVDGIRPEFKEAMDSYEKFFDEYVAFMKAYMDSDDPLSMMGEYTTMMQQYVETMGKLEDIDEDELSEEEALYYADVMLQINQKLLEVV